MKAPMYAILAVLMCGCQGSATIEGMPREHPPHGYPIKNTFNMESIGGRELSDTRTRELIVGSVGKDLRRFSLKLSDYDMLIRSYAGSEHVPAIQAGRRVGSLKNTFERLNSELSGEPLVMVWLDRKGDSLGGYFYYFFREDSAELVEAIRVP